MGKPRAGLHYQSGADRTEDGRHEFGMASFEVLQVIFKGKAKRLADAWGVKLNSAHKFLRSPEASGAANPLDRFCRVIDEAVLADRSKSGLLIEYLRSYYNRLVADQHPVGERDWRPREDADRILQLAVEVVRVLALKDQSLGRQMQALVEARDAIESAILSLEGQADDENLAEIQP